MICKLWLTRATSLALSLGLTLILVPSLAASAAATEPTNLASGAATRLTISYSEKVADELPLWIAVDAGYFKKWGLDVTARYLPSQEGIPALLAGQVQMAAIGGAVVISAAAQGAQLKYVANFSPVYTFQFWARPQYAKPELLKGQRIGVSSTAGSVYTATLLSLRQLGLAPSDVALTPLGSVPNIDNALLAGSIVAAVSHPPVTYYFQQKGFIDMVDLAKKRIPNVNTGLVATDSYIQAHPKIVASVVDAIIEGSRREKSDKNYAESELRKYLGIKEQAVLDFTYNFYAKEVAPTMPMPKAAELEVAKQALSVSNPKVKMVDLPSLIDQTFVKRAAQGSN